MAFSVRNKITVNLPTFMTKYMKNLSIFTNEPIPPPPLNDTFKNTKDSNMDYRFINQYLIQKQNELDMKRLRNQSSGD